MSGPVMWALPVLPGHDADLEVALDAMPDEAFRWLVPDGKYAVFKGQGELCIFIEKPELARLTQDAWADPDASALREALAEHTAFDDNKAIMWMTRDVHHAGDPVETPRAVPQEY